MRRLLAHAVSLSLLALGVPAIGPGHGSAPPARQLQVSVAKAPVAPNGTTTGAVTDLVLTFRDPDPHMAGIGLRAGGTVVVTLPSEFVDTGQAPFQDFGTPGCAPPRVGSCNTALLLQGWPQSPVPPFPSVTWDATARTITARAVKDWLPGGPAAPGPKQIHLLLLGFRNPQRAGSYPLRLEVRPDPAGPERWTGTGRARILGGTRPSIEVVSTVNGAPPPPFPDAIHQTAKPGDPLLRYGFYLWDRDGRPFEGVRLLMRSRRHGVLLDREGHLIGRVRVDAPRRADEVELVSEGPAATVAAFITGIPTALLTARLVTDPDKTGRYTVSVSLFGGNRQSMVVEVTR